MLGKNTSQLFTFLIIFKKPDFMWWKQFYEVNLFTSMDSNFAHLMLRNANVEQCGFIPMKHHWYVNHLHCSPAQRRGELGVFKVKCSKWCVHITDCGTPTMLYACMLTHLLQNIIWLGHTRGTACGFTIAATNHWVYKFNWRFTSNNNCYTHQGMLFVLHLV